jgi:hypothetical protein
VQSALQLRNLKLYGEQTPVYCASYILFGQHVTYKVDILPKLYVTNYCQKYQLVKNIPMYQVSVVLMQFRHTYSMD